MKQHIDLNSDMGEGFGPWLIGDGTDEAIMTLITSANVATGFHAGDPNIMRKTVQMAKARKVGVGAHPGFRDLVGFGRRHMNTSPQELVNDFIYQVGALREFTRLEGIPLHHVKPHGSLYMHAAQDETFSRVLIEALQTLEPTLPIYCMEQSFTYRVAQEMGHPAVREFYADRDYSTTGSIVFTHRSEELDPAAVATKVIRACTEGKVHTVEGKDIAINFDSICVHSDTPGALKLLQAIRKSLQEAGITVKRVAGNIKT